MTFDYSWSITKIFSLLIKSRFACLYPHVPPSMSVRLVSIRPTTLSRPFHVAYSSVFPRPPPPRQCPYCSRLRLSELGGMVNPLSWWRQWNGASGWQRRRQAREPDRQSCQRGSSSSGQEISGQGGRGGVVSSPGD